MSRYMQDDIQTALSKGRPGSALPRRVGTEYGSLNLDELTSRVSSADITRTLDDMATPFDPAFDSTLARKRRREALARHEKVPNRKINPMTSSSQPPCCRLASTSPGLA